MIYGMESGILDSSGVPVGDNMDVELIAQHFNAQLYRLAWQRSRGRLVVAVWSGVAAAGCAVGAIAAFANGGSSQNVLGLIAAASAVSLALVAAGLISRAGEVRTEARVRRICRVYWPTARFSAVGSSVLVDLACAYPPTTVAYTTLRDVEALRTAVEAIRDISDLESLSPMEAEAPRREIAGHPHFGTELNLLEAIAAAATAIEDTEERSGSASIINPPTQLAAAIEALLPHMRGNPKIGPVVRSQRLVEAQAGFEAILGLYLSSRADGEATVMALTHKAKRTSARALVRRREAREDLRGLLRDMSSALNCAMVWSSFNPYCAYCNSDPARGLSAATRLRPSSSGEWRCPICHQVVTPDRTILVDKFRDEIFNKIHDHVLADNLKQIAAIDAGVTDQLQQALDAYRAARRTLLQKQRERQFERRAEIRRLAARGSALRHQLDATSTTLAKYEKISETLRARYHEDYERIHAEVQERGDRAVAEIEERFKEWHAEAVKEEQRRVAIARLEEERRHQEQIGVLHDIKHELTEGQRKMIDEQRKSVKVGLMTDQEKEDYKGTGVMKAFRRWGTNIRTSRAHGRL